MQHKLGVSERFTKEYKINWIFERLILRYNPELNILNSNKITLPFPDIQLKITTKSITMIGSDFIYKFPLSRIVEIWDKLQKL